MTTRNIVLQFTNFDFDKTDRAFLERHIESQYAPKARQLNGTMRQWLRERSFNPHHNVSYDLRSSVEDGVTTRVIETGAVNDGGNEIITIQMEKVHVDSFDKNPNLVTSDRCLEMVDSVFAFYNKVTDKKYIGILSSLRPLLRDIITSVPEIYVIAGGDRNWEFDFVLPEGGDSHYVNKITLQVHYHNFMGEN